MMKHPHRLIGIVLVALTELAVALAPSLDWLDEETARTVGQAVLAIAVTVGVVDAAVVERARRDVRRPALSDDRRDGGES